jgi:O-antigen ligase
VVNWRKSFSNTCRNPVNPPLAPVHGGFFVTTPLLNTWVISMPALVAFVFVALPWLNPFSPGPTSSVGPFLFSWLCAALVLLALAVARQNGRIPAMVRAIALAWLAAAGLNALIGLLQYFAVTESFGVWLNHPQFGEAYGNLRQRNQFATLLNIGLLALLGLAASPDQPALAWYRPPQPPGRLAFGLCMAALLGCANAASSSRTGLLQLVLVLLMMLWWRQGAESRHLKLPLLLTAVLAYAAASVALPLLAGLDPLGSGALARLRAGDPVCASRLTLWSNVLHLIAQKPWLGWGWGELDYAHFITLYPGVRFCDILDNAHNLPLHLAVELGVPAALLICTAGLLLVWLGQPWRERDAIRQMAWGILAVMLLHSLLEYPLWYGPFQMAAALSVWLLCWVPRSGVRAYSYKVFRPLSLYSQALIAMLLIAFCGFAAWNYHLAGQIYLAPEERAEAYRQDTLEKTRHVWLFQDQVRFAELTLAEPNVGNALVMHALALDMLHFSPEARVVEAVLDSALILGRRDEVAFFAKRFAQAFRADYVLWAQKNPAAVASP